ncbi:3-hydroxyacyl-CoA dehydrogenase family protein [Antrihabitans cavernicola]|uniref:3-hydroxyacyl-CoA dehydrogenase family protein n=1 Tax=Antrihabitans cavernicola TaxID=2495913 RepID=UPI003FA40AD6
MLGSQIIMQAAYHGKTVTGYYEQDLAGLRQCTLRRSHRGRHDHDRHCRCGGRRRLGHRGGPGEPGSQAEGVVADRRGRAGEDDLHDELLTAAAQRLRRRQRSTREVPRLTLRVEAAAAPYVDGIGDPGDIDKGWRIATGSPTGPFEVYDFVGFNVVAHIARNADDDRQHKFADMLRKSADAGKSGLGDGQGYTYDSEESRGEPVQDWTITD